MLKSCKLHLLLLKLLSSVLHGRMLELRGWSLCLCRQSGSLDLRLQVCLLRVGSLLCQRCKESKLPSAHSVSTRHELVLLTLRLSEAALLWGAESIRGHALASSDTHAAVRWHRWPTSAVHTRQGRDVHLGATWSIGRHLRSKLSSVHVALLLLLLLWWGAVAVRHDEGLTPPVSVAFFSILLWFVMCQAGAID